MITDWRLLRALWVWDVTRVWVSGALMVASIALQVGFFVPVVAGLLYGLSLSRLRRWGVISDAEVPGTRR